MRTRVIVLARCRARTETGPNQKVKPYTQAQEDLGREILMVYERTDLALVLVDIPCKRGPRAAIKKAATILDDVFTGNPHDYGDVQSVIALGRGIPLDSWSLIQSFLDAG